MKRNLFFLLLSIILFFQCDAQNLQNIDSLKNLLKSIEEKKPRSSSDTIKANILYLISKEYWSGDLDKSMEYAKRVLSLSQTIHYKKGEGNAYSSMGVIYWYKGEYPQALENNERALKIREERGNKDDVGRSYNNIGLIYEDKGNFPEALLIWKQEIMMRHIKIICLH
jgi:tetratricopeptide (TPR) repeat protein